MVNDPRFSRRIVGEKEKARLNRALISVRAALLRSHTVPVRSTDSHLQKLFRSAVRELAGRNVPCHPSDLVTIAQGNGFTSETFKESQEAPKIIIEAFSAELMAYLKENPEAMRQLPGHVFEEMLADILAYLGFEQISLRVRTELGEVDILGFTKDTVGIRIAYIFELKQLGKSMRSVSLSEVTRLYGLREGLRQKLGVTQGVFATTTNYTLPARELGSIHHLSLKAYEGIVDWLERYQPPGRGVHLRLD